MTLALMMMLRDDTSVKYIPSIQQGKYRKYLLNEAREIHSTYFKTSAKLKKETNRSHAVTLQTNTKNLYCKYL